MLVLSVQQVWLVSVSQQFLQTILGGKLVKIQPDEAIESFQSNRPSPTFQGFLDFFVVSILIPTFPRIDIFSFTPRRSIELQILFSVMIPQADMKK